MKKAWILVGTAVLLAGWTSRGADLSGQWTSGIALTSGGVSLAGSFTLHLAGLGWRLTSSWDPILPTFSHHSFVLQGSLGIVDWTAGLSFRVAAGGEPLIPQAQSGLFSGQDLSWTGGFVSFEIVLDKLTLRVTLVSERGE